jgi:hypothetical protein
MLFRRLFKQTDAVMLLDAAEQILGTRYQLRYKVLEQEADQTAPAEILMQRAQSDGIRTGIQEDAGV